MFAIGLFFLLVAASFLLGDILFTSFDVRIIFASAAAAIVAIGMFAADGLWALKRRAKRGSESAHS